MYTECQNKENRIKEAYLFQKSTNNFAKHKTLTNIYGTDNLHTGTGLVERTIQSLKNLIVANLEVGQNLRESIKRALYVLIFTKHSELKKRKHRLKNILNAPPELNYLI